MDNLKAKEPFGPLGLPLSSAGPDNCPSIVRPPWLVGRLGGEGLGLRGREGRGPPHMASPSKTLPL